MSVYDTTCFYTTVKNISGSTLTFSFLPPHGQELTNNEEFTMLGDVFGALTKGHRATSQKYYNSFLKCLSGDNGLNAKLLSVISTPAVFVVDTVSSTTYTLSVHSGSVVSHTPCSDSTL